ncbi:LysR substrate-binding domain-containing protein [soil metagenome]
MVMHAIESRLKLRHYSLLIAIDEHRSITRVAEMLGVSQPSVTRALTDIESIFGTLLFTRSRSGLQPTAAGAAVLARARLSLQEHALLAEELKLVGAGWRGQLRIGLIPYTPVRLLDAAWAHLLGLQPRVTLLVHEDTTHNLLVAVRKRELDCAICRFSRESVDSDLTQELLLSQPLGLLVGTSAARHLARRKLDVAVMARLDWIFPPPDTPTKEVINAIFAAAGCKVPVPAMQTYSQRTIASALRRLPDGATILPRDIATEIAASGAGTLLTHELPWTLPPIGLTRLQGAHNAVEIDALVKALGQVS